MDTATVGGNFKGCPWESVHSQGIGCRCIKMFGYKCGVEEAKLRGFVQVGQNLGEFFCAPEISSDSSLGKNVKCRGIGEFLPIKPSTCGELAPVCHRGSSNRTNKFYLFILCVCVKAVNQSINMWKKAIVGGQRKKHQQRPRHTCTLQSQPLHPLHFFISVSLNLCFCGFWCP